MTTRINDSVIDTAREEAATLTARIARAEEVYRDLAGHKEHGGLTLNYHGDYVAVDDGADRCLAETTRFQDGLDAVLNNIIDKGRHMDADECSSYDALCSECPALYSRIGSGEYNPKPWELLAKLSKSLDESVVVEIADYLGIDTDVMVDEALESLPNWRSDGDGYIYHADETDEDFSFTRADALRLYALIQADSGSAYSLWCAECGELAEASA